MCYNPKLFFLWHLPMEVPHFHPGCGVRKVLLQEPRQHAFKAKSVENGAFWQAVSVKYRSDASLSPSSTSIGIAEREPRHFSSLAAGNNAAMGGFKIAIDRAVRHFSSRHSCRTCSHGQL